MQVTNEKLPILVDIDGVLGDFVQAYFEIAYRKFRKLHDVLPNRHEVNEFYIHDSIDPKYKSEEILAMSREVVNDPEMFQNILPINNAIVGVHLLEELSDREVFFVSAPHNTNLLSYTQKAEWVKLHFGIEYLDRLLLVRDKTLVNGIVLIDDKPNPMGAHAPIWEHIVFDQPCNRTQSACKGKYRMMGWEPSEVKRLLNYIKIRNNK